MKGKWDNSSDEDEENKSKRSSKKQKSLSKCASIASMPEVSEITIPVSNITESISEPSFSKSTSQSKLPLSELNEVNQTPKELTEPSYNPIFQGCRSVESYQRLSFIDQGTYGMVFRAKDIKTNEVYALKQVKLGPETSKVGFPVTALREINILLALQHPNIITVKEMVVGSSIDKIYMVMEYCENDLKECMKTSKQSFSISEIKRLMIQLLSAVNHMHNLWYIHRDLKSSNLLYSNKGVLKVCDFGLARRYGDPIEPYTYEVVTLWYRAPELLLGERKYSTQIDMWSVGCIFAEMLLGDPIFPGEGEIDQMNKIFTALGPPNDNIYPGFAALPNWPKVSKRLHSKGNLSKLFPIASFAGGLTLNESGYDLLTQILQMNPTKRMTAKTALEHKYLNDEAPLPTEVVNMPKFKSNHE